MSPFRKIYEELKKKVNVDFELKDNGVSLDLSLNNDNKEEKKEEEKSVRVLVGVAGVYNPIGGIMICVLQNDGEYISPTIPNFTNTANLFLFLNGKLLPDCAQDCTLSEYILNGKTLEDMFCGDDDPHLETLEGMLSDTDRVCEDDIPLNDGYNIAYKYIFPSSIRDSIEESENMGDFRSYLVDEIKDIVSFSTTGYRHINLIKVDDPTSDEPLSDWNESQKVLKDMAVDMLWTEYKGDRYTREEESISLADVTATYLYSNILRQIEQEIKNITKSPDAHDIPWTNEDLRQTKWLAKVKKSTKDPESWAKVERMFVADWALK